MLYPLPVVLVSTSDGKGKDNLITIAWAWTVPVKSDIAMGMDRRCYLLNF